jgi:mevalonate kinase
MGQDFDIVSQLCEVITESEEMTNEVMDHLDIILEKLDNLTESKDLQSDIDSIRNNVHITLESMQAQDMHRQKIERVVNSLDPENGRFAKSAKHLQGDDNSDLVSPDELEALIAAANS